MALEKEKSREREYALCMRVLTMSSGCTIRVAMEPAESPAAVSTRAGERPASLVSVIETIGDSRYMSGAKARLLFLVAHVEDGWVVAMLRFRSSRHDARVPGEKIPATLGRTKEKPKGATHSTACLGKMSHAIRASGN